METFIQKAKAYLIEQHGDLAREIAARRVEMLKASGDSSAASWWQQIIESMDKDKATDKTDA